MIVKPGMMYDTGVTYLKSGTQLTQPHHRRSGVQRRQPRRLPTEQEALAAATAGGLPTGSSSSDSSSSVSGARLRFSLRASSCFCVPK
ncbi:unnamed protein product [Mycena citricolor]|uniref:Uncharacterized protein n=1 Tax=Mycena citricolor TaxID=2018698 RepID=A0AAD2GW27_9AGAR|nr:unnamed protein product [Mycena citricolor]